MFVSALLSVTLDSIVVHLKPQLVTIGSMYARYGDIAKEHRRNCKASDEWVGAHTYFYLLD